MAFDFMKPLMTIILSFPPAHPLGGSRTATQLCSANSSH